MNMLFRSAVILLSVVVSTVSATEKIFDLQAQYFDETLDKKNDTGYKMGRYDLPNVLFYTNTIMNATDRKIYIPRPKAGWRDKSYGGFMSLTLKKPATNWVYVEDRMSYDDGSDSDEVDSDRGCSADAIIRLTSDTGNSFYVAFNDKKIVVNNETFAIEIVKTTNFITEISKQGDIFLMKINGQTLLKTSIKNFGKLSKVYTTIPYYYRGGEEEIKQIELYAE